MGVQSVAQGHFGHTSVNEDETLKPLISGWPPHLLNKADPKSWTLHFWTDTFFFFTHLQFVLHFWKCYYLLNLNEVMHTLEIMSCPNCQEILISSFYSSYTVYTLNISVFIHSLNMSLIAIGPIVFSQAWPGCAFLNSHFLSLYLISEFSGQNWM